MRITASDGHVTGVDEYGTAGSPAVLFLPALGVPVSYYAPFLTSWADAGFHVHGLELRGMPQSSIRDVRRTDFGYNELLTLDIPAALAALPSAPAALVGHSLGGQLALLFAASNPGFERPIVTIASGSSHHSPVASRRGRLVRRWQATAVPAIASALGYFPGNLLGFGGNQPVSMMKDWGFEAKRARYEVGGGTSDLEAGLSAMPNRALALTLDGDRLISARAAALLHDRLGSATLTRAHLERTENGGEPFDHFRWARRNPDVVVRTLTAWL